MIASFPTAQPRQVASKPEIDLFLRAMHTLLRSSGEVQLRALSETYAAMESSLHVRLQEDAPDLACLTYATLRLPACMPQVKHVLLGQTDETFRRQGFAAVERWQPVEARSRRRKMRFDGADTLAVYIGSPSDVDDLVPTLLALELEWNKLHARLWAHPEVVELLGAADEATLDDQQRQAIVDALGLDAAGWSRLGTIWDGRVCDRLREIAAAKKHFGVRLLGGSLNDFNRAMHVWWRHLEAGARRTDFETRPIYFVSSNTHTLANLLGGFARTHERELLHFARQPSGTELDRLLDSLPKEQAAPGLKENFLYYALRHYLAHPGNRHARTAKLAAESEVGITTVTSSDALAIDAQVIELGKLRPDLLDPRLSVPGLSWLTASDALIVNVDYPLGYAAYQVLHTVSYHVSVLRGLYVMGKAATLNGRVGDVMIAGEYHDEHSGNTYLVDNCFIAQDVAPFLVYGTALDNQQAVAVRGTYLQNHRYLDELYTAGYTVVEMEAGPYLDALYEDTFVPRYPEGQRVNLYGAPCDVGIIHYASDTPFSQGHNLGERSLSYFGMDATYAAAVAIVRRIFSLELARLEGERDGRVGISTRRRAARPAAMVRG